MIMQKNQDLFSRRMGFSKTHMLRCCLFLGIFDCFAFVRCDGETCGDLPFISHATLDTEGKEPPFDLGVQIPLRCNAGFISGGKRLQLECVIEEGTAVWKLDESEPCSPKRCGFPGDIENAQRVGNDFFFPNNVTYTCNEGFKIRGRSSVFCLASGNWGPSLPSCEAITCPPPDGLENGWVLHLDRNYGSFASYECDLGFSMEGPNHRTCGKDSLWSDQAPVCKAKSCGFPGDIENAQRVGNDFSYPGTVKYTCNEGFKMRGRSSVYCSPSGDWRPSFPSCEAITCPRPDDLENGRVIIGNVSYGSTATYECDRGFSLEGPNHRTCGKDSLWSDEAPLCKVSKCLLSDKLENGKIIYKKDNYKFNDLVIFICNSGGQRRPSKCLDKGIWSSNPPTCPGTATTAIPITIPSASSFGTDAPSSPASSFGTDAPSSPASSFGTDASTIVAVGSTKTDEPFIPNVGSTTGDISTSFLNNTISSTKLTPNVGDRTDALSGFEVFFPHEKAIRFRLGLREFVLATKVESTKIFMSGDVTSTKPALNVLIPWLGNEAFTGSGAEWKAQRKFWLALFRYQLLTEFTPTFDKQSKDLVDLLKRRHDEE